MSLRFLGNIAFLRGFHHFFHFFFRLFAGKWSAGSWKGRVRCVAFSVTGENDWRNSKVPWVRCLRRSVHFLFFVFCFLRKKERKKKKEESDSLFFRMEIKQNEGVNELFFAYGNKAKRRRKRVVFCVWK